MHDRKNEILLEKISLGVSYAFYIYILLGKCTVVNCWIFPLWDLIPHIASSCRHM